LAPKAELMAWDITALGLDHANAPFTSGRFLQHMEIPGIWLERGLIDALDHRLLNSPLGMAGHRCMGTLVFASGSPLESYRAELALESARAVIDGDILPIAAGITQVNPQVMVLRVLAPMVEPSIQLMKKIWAIWRETLWQLPGQPPRLWHL
jgi:urease accessory protein